MLLSVCFQYGMSIQEIFSPRPCIFFRMKTDTSSHHENHGLGFYPSRRTTRFHIFLFECESLLSVVIRELRCQKLDPNFSYRHEANPNAPWVDRFFRPAGRLRKCTHPLIHGFGPSLRAKNPALRGFVSYSRISPVAPAPGSGMLIAHLVRL